jgi:heptosyltransferase-1
VRAGDLGSRGYGAYFALRRRLTVARTVLPPPPPAFDAGEIRRALLVCTGLIGDTVMCLPAVSAARALLPRAEIVALATESSRAALALAGGIDRFIVTDGAPLRLRPSARRAARDLELRLRAEDFTLAVIFLGDDYAPLLTRAAVPHRVFVAESAFARLSTVTYPIGNARTWGAAERLGSWRALGLEPPPMLPISPPDGTVRSVLDRFAGMPRPWTAVHPFGRTADQWWPLPSAAAAALALRERFGGTYFLIGGAETCAAGGAPAWMVDLRGQLPLEHLVGLLGASDCVISTDSGPYHLAGVIGGKGVGLFRAARPEHAGRYRGIRAVMAPDIAACARECRWDRCEVRPCRQMAVLTPGAVVAAAADALASS